MNGIMEVAREDLAVIEQAYNAADQAIERILAQAREMERTDRVEAGTLLEAARVVGRGEQRSHARLIQLLGQADRVKAHPAGVSAWVATNLDVSESKARGIAEAARRIGVRPELSEPLASGRLGADSIRTLARAVKAVAGTSRDTTAVLTETLRVTEDEGTGAARRYVRVLEHTLDPGSSEKLLDRQRSRSFARIAQSQDGMCHLEAALDPVRATTLRTALDLLVADWIRQRQYDGATPVPEDVRTTDHLYAHALTRLAEVFLTAPPGVRGAQFTTPVAYTAPLEPDADNPLAESVYGTLIPRNAITPPGDPGAHLIHHHNGQPVLLDGAVIDTNTTARLASPAQRTALAVRDRHCTQPGCNRPPTWSLHAHHRIAYRDGGPTTLCNLQLLCAEHHTLTHHPHYQPDETE